MSELTYRSNPRALVTALPDGSAVLLELDSGVYYSLNRTGQFIFSNLGSGATIGQLVQAMMDRFEVDAETAEADLKVLLDELVTNRLVLT
jgi:hypothetical protein